VALNFDLDALIAGTGDTYTYTVASSDATNVPAGNPRTAPTAANITDNYTNTTTAPVIITYTVTPIGSNGCTGNNFMVAVTVNPEPVVTNQTAATCSDVTLNFDLDALIAGTGDTYTYTVGSSDATNVPAASPRTTASATNITDVYTNTTTAPVIITYTVTPIGSNGCAGNTFTVAVTVNPEPVVSNQIVTTCSDVALNFDLDALIAGTGDTFTFTVASSDATNVPAASPRTAPTAANITDNYTNTTTAPVIITYTVTPIGSNGCTGNTFTVAVTVNPEPVVTNQTTATCSDVALNYDLDALVSGAGDTYTYTVASSDATNVPAGNPRTSPTAANITDNYTNTTMVPVIITYTVTPISSNGCIGSTFTVVVTVNPEPVVTNQTVTTCSDVALNYDLASLITGTGDTYTYTVTSSDATNVPAGNPRTVASAANITDLYTNTTSAAVTISYTITPIGSNGCTGNSFILAATIHPNPVILPITNFELCDDTTDGDDTNGIVNFNLLLKNSEILGTQTGINITYHTDSNAAILGQNAITNIISTNRIIYVRLTNSTTGCFSTTSFNLVVNPLPVVDSSVELKQCDTDSDAVTDFNLTQANLRISPDTSLTYTYHNSLAGAVNNTDFVTNDIVHTAANGDKVWARITNIFGCSRTSEVNLVVSATTIPSTYTYPLSACDDYLNASDPDGDGIDYFDLTVIEPVLTAQFPVGQSYTYSYYFNEADAISEQNAITNTTNFRNTVPFNQPIWVRIESNLYDCAGLGSYLSLTVNPLPDFDLGQDLILCVDPVTGQGSQILNAIPTTAGTYSYQWTPANPSGNSGLFTITTAGTYSVVVTNTTTGCQSSDSISFTTSSGPATIVAVLTTEAFSSGLATIEAVVTGGFGIYEYSLDGIDWQSSPVFSGLENGSYTIYVRDIQGCDLLPSEPIQTITYPNYFTPNGDGYNDTWMIRLPVNYEAMISIFDRYGKLIKQISSFGAGWDGTYNGNLMPSTDYWFKVEYTENNIRKEFKSHFSLKR
jgi:gliding motility-associated-like protein